MSAPVAARLLALALVLALLAAAGCAAAGRLLGLPPRLERCPGPLIATGELPGGDFLLRERVRVRGGDVDAGFELVAERRGERLTVVALHPLGAKAFSAEQRGLALETTSHMGRALAVPPENLLADLHAARFRAAESPRRVEISRPGCGYTATFSRVERRPLG